MTAMELDARRMELIRKIMETDSVEVLDKVKMSFLFAQYYHSSMKNVGPVRKEMGERTIFNILGPLTNPANAKSIPGVPSSLEEVKQDIAAFEADLDADILETVSHQDVMKDVRQMLASL